MSCTSPAVKYLLQASQARCGRMVDRTPSGIENSPYAVAMSSSFGGSAMFQVSACTIDDEGVRVSVSKSPWDGLTTWSGEVHGGRLWRPS